jgi:hypothetical protein
MSDQQQPPEQLQAQLAQLLAQVQGQQPQPQAPVSAGWARPQVAPTEAQSVSIPIKLNTPSGSLRAYLNFDGSAASSPEALMALIESLERMGVPLDFWRAGAASGWGSGSRGGSGWRR